MTVTCCSDAGRRGAVRERGLTGFDWIEVDGSQRVLSVAFIGAAPAWIGPANLRIAGGRGKPDIAVVDVRIEPSREEDLDDIMMVTVDRPGDHSSYRLKVVALDDRGRPTERTPPGFDPRYTGIDFSFKACCPTDQDPAACPDRPEPASRPAAISYLAKDYRSFRQLMLDRMALTAPGWTELHAPDLSITLVEILAYAADDLSYYQDAVATEAFLGTARRRESVRRHARLVDYALDEGLSAEGWAQVSLDQGTYTLDLSGLMFTTAISATTPAVARAETVRLAGDELVFEAEAGTIELRAAHNRIDFHDWDGSECCIPAGATRATLRDPGRVPEPDGGAADERRREADDADLEGGIREGRWHQLWLRTGDVLILAEVVGPRTGYEADADPAKRHAVRLVSADYDRDPVSGVLTVEIAWCPEDALPFPLCLSTRTAPPECRQVSGVSVALGNIVPVDHGRMVEDPLEPVRTAAVEDSCDGPCRPSELRIVTRRYRPRLPRGVPAFLVAPADGVGFCGSCEQRSASRRGAAEGAAGLPAITLSSTAPSDLAARPRLWQPRADLLDSEADERHFVVEPDDEGGATLRFGDGVQGLAPEGGEAFIARYRIGGGSRGNIGADMLRHILVPAHAVYPEGVAMAVRNPLPMRGGRERETAASAKLRAPFTHRRRIARAVTAEDYAEIVMRDFGMQVQRAAASLRATGVRLEVQVAIDQFGRFEADPAILACIERHLDRFRRMDHDLRVVPVRYVPIHLELEICVAPWAIAEDVGRRVRARLGAGPSGFFSADALSFGQGIALSRLLAAVHEVPGVTHAHPLALNRLYHAPDGELDAGLLAIAADEIARLDQDPDAPQNGYLDLAMKGGR